MPTIQTEQIKSVPPPAERRADYFLGHPPGWLVNWGMTLILVTAAVFLLLAWLIRYPDIITAEVKILTENPPIRVGAPAGGKIAEIFTEDGQRVAAGDELLLLESTADLRDIRTLEKILAADDPTDAPLPDSLNLGELQTGYALLRQQTAGYRYFLSREDVAGKINALKKQIMHTEELNRQAARERKTLRSEYEIYAGDYQRHLALQRAGTVSRIELENKEKAWLQARRQLENLENQVLGNKIRIEQLKTQIIDLRQSKSNESNTNRVTLAESRERLAADIKIWKQKYLLTAPIAGKISLNTDYREKQYVTPGDEIMTVVPAAAGQQITAAGLIPTAGTGKIKIGMPVNLQVSGYPYQEFGLVRARVAAIAAVPQADNYLLQLELTDGLNTTYRKTLRFRQEMPATAEIITEDRRILDRIFDKIRSILQNT